MLGYDANPAEMDPLTFARLVKGASAHELQQLMRGERRQAVLDELLRQMPGAFRADKAGSLDAVVHWNIADRLDGGSDVYELVISRGTCRLSPSPQHEPQLTLSIGAVDFLRVVTGNAHPVALVMKGRLRTKGELGLIAKFPTLFAVPRP
jgi:hypothetical protein